MVEPEHSPYHQSALVYCCLYDARLGRATGNLGAQALRPTGDRDTGWLRDFCRCGQVCEQDRMDSGTKFLDRLGALSSAWLLLPNADQGARQDTSFHGCWWSDGSDSSGKYQHLSRLNGGRARRAFLEHGTADAMHRCSAVFPGRDSCSDQAMDSRKAGAGKLGKNQRDYQPFRVAAISVSFDGLCAGNGGVAARRIPPAARANTDVVALETILARDAAGIHCACDSLVGKTVGSETGFGPSFEMVRG